MNSDDHQHTRHLKFTIVPPWLCSVEKFNLVSVFFEPLQSLKPWTVKWIHLIMNSQDHDWLRVELGVLILQKIVNYKLQWRWSGTRVPAVLLPNRSSTQLTFLLAQTLSRVVLRESFCSIINCSTDPETAIPWECHFMLDYL